MVCTRHRFISSVGDDQEKYYEQKYLLTVPITQESEVVQEPPQSWVEFCARQGMCDDHLDAVSCMQSAVSRGFHTDALMELAQVYIEHGFLSEEEADIFLSEIPVLGEGMSPSAGCLIKCWTPRVMGWPRSLWKISCNLHGIPAESIPMGGG